MDFTMEPYDEVAAATWLLCRTCGTQFPTSDPHKVKTCHICDDPRQFVPPSGQSFTTLADLRRNHHNEFKAYPKDPRVVFIETVPRLAIGQRAALLKTLEGNVLWDCVALLDEETVATIEEMGGLKAIVISHPHYYTTHVLWARAFQCPVYVAEEDESWTTLQSLHRRTIKDVETDVLPGSGVKAIKVGGHFPGSLVLLYGGRLFIADTVVTTPSGMGDWSVNGMGEIREEGRPKGMTTFVYMWSIPNMLPLNPEQMAQMWDILSRYDFKATHGAFRGMDIEDEDVKGRVLQSMQLQTLSMGYANHPLLDKIV